MEKLFEHFGQPKPEFQGNEDPGYKLRNLLKQVGGSPIVLVLDDVWPGSECFVEKFKVPILDLKILVTSRAELNLESCILRHIQRLSQDDSMTLFRQYAQLNDTRPHNDLTDQVLSLFLTKIITEKNQAVPFTVAYFILFAFTEMQAVRCCGGLPLFLQII